MELPPQFLSDLSDIVDQFTGDRGHRAMEVAATMVGKAGRVAYVIPEARPFVAALYGALHGAKAAQDRGHREAPPGRVAVARFRVAARWFRALLQSDSDHLFPLQRHVYVHDADVPISNHSVLFDASPWGGGAALREGSKIIEYFFVKWGDKQVRKLKVQVGLPKFQSFWEFLTSLLALIRWGDKFTTSSLALLGDNTSALTDAIDLKGKDEMLAIARELAWRKARRG